MEGGRACGFSVAWSRSQGAKDREGGGELVHCLCQIQDHLGLICFPPAENYGRELCEDP